jgi:DNA-binding MarR family transcriptional regulator
LTPTDTSILASIGLHGPIGMGDLGRREAVNATMVSRVVTKLERAGWATRQPDAADARRWLVRLTEQGRVVHSRIRQVRSSALIERLNRLTADQSAAIAAALPALEALAHDSQPPATAIDDDRS